MTTLSLDRAIRRFRRQVVIATAASIEQMNLDNRSGGNLDAILAPWDPRGLAGEFARLDADAIAEDCLKITARFPGSRAERHVAALGWACKKLDALRLGVSADMLDGGREV